MFRTEELQLAKYSIVEDGVFLLVELDRIAGRSDNGVRRQLLLLLRTDEQTV